MLTWRHHRYLELGNRDAITRAHPADRIVALYAKSDTRHATALIDMIKQMTQFDPVLRPTAASLLQQSTVFSSMTTHEKRNCFVNEAGHEIGLDAITYKKKPMGDAS